KGGMDSWAISPCKLLIRGGGAGGFACLPDSRGLLPRAAIRRESSKRFWFDVHAAVEIVSFVFLLLLTVTGLMIGFEGATTPLLYKITGSQPSPPPRAEITAPPGARPITPDQAFNVARAALPGAAAFLINVPEPHEPYFVRMRYPEDLTPGGRSRVAATLWSIPTRAKRSGRRV